MKLIIEIIDGEPFAYIENFEAFERNQKERAGLTRYDHYALDRECALNRYEDGYWVFNFSADQCLSSYRHASINILPTPAPAPTEEPKCLTNSSSSIPPSISVSDLFWEFCLCQWS